MLMRAASLHFIVIYNNYFISDAVFTAKIIKFMTVQYNIIQ